MYRLLTAFVLATLLIAAVPALSEDFGSVAQVSVAQVNSGSDILQFYKEAGASWQAFNISSSLGVKVVGDPSLYANDTSVSLYARDTNDYLYQFYKEPSSPWQAFNLSAITNASAGSDPAVWFNGSTTSVFVRSTDSQLLQYYKEPLSDWQVFNLSVLTGTSASGKPTVFTNGSSVSVFIRDEADNLLQFYKEPTSSWQAFNISAMTGAKINGNISMFFNSGTVNIFTRSNQNELLHFYKNQSAAWEVYNLTSITGRVIVGDPAVDTSSTSVSVYVRGNNRALLQFYKEPTDQWQVFDLTASTQVSVLGNPKVYKTNSTVSVFVQGNSNELVQFYKEPLTAWTAYNLSAEASTPASGVPEIVGNSSALSVYVRTPSVSNYLSANVLRVPYVDQVYVQGNTEGGIWNHCGPATVAMLLAYEGKESRDVTYDRQATLDLVCPLKTKCLGATTIDIGKFLQGYNLQARTQNGAPSFDAIKQSIINGHPVVLSLNIPGGHLVLAVGYTDNGQIVIHDPFGGSLWWSDKPENRNDRNMIPGRPQSKGTYTAYSYTDPGSSNLPVKYSVFIDGPAPDRPPLSAPIDAVGGTMNGDGFQLVFPPISASLANVSTIQVTYTPQTQPNYSINGYETSFGSFRVGGANQSGEAQAQYPVPYDLTINLNEQDFIAWQDRIGNIPAANGSASSSSAVEPLTEARIVLAAWDPIQHEWTPVSATVDLTNYTITARTQRFTEFAVLIKLQHGIYLPLLKAQ